MSDHKYMYFALTNLRKQPYPSVLCDLDDFQDISYGNDCADSVCFSIGGQGYFMWVDCVARRDREEESALRFWISTYDIEEGEIGDEELLSTESPADVFWWVDAKVSAARDGICECGQIEGACECPCINCKLPMSMHGIPGNPVMPGTDCPESTCVAALPSLESLIRRGLAFLDIDEACREVQDALGVTDGGLAGIMLNDDSWRDNFADYVKAERNGVIEEMEAPVSSGFSPLLGMLGSEVMFHADASKVIGNYELALYLKCGVVTCVGPDTLEVRLNEPCDDLDEWDNTLIWAVEDCLAGDRMDNWDSLSDLQKCSFFEGYLAGLVTE